jgi:hypothetical protein
LISSGLGLRIGGSVPLMGLRPSLCVARRGRLSSSGGSCAAERQIGAQELTSCGPLKFVSTLRVSELEMDG